MPLKVSVGLPKKKGLPKFGSVGASCHIEIELDGALLQNDPERLQQQVRRAYVACAQAVADELARQYGPLSAASTTQPPRENSVDSPHGGSENAVSNPKISNGRAPTAKQLEYANRLAGQIKGLGVRRLEALTRKLFDKSVAELSRLDASVLLDTLTEIKDGGVSVGEVLNGVVAQVQKRLVDSTYSGGDPSTVRIPEDNLIPSANDA